MAIFNGVKEVFKKLGTKAVEFTGSKEVWKKLGKQVVMILAFWSFLALWHTATGTHVGTSQEVFARFIEAFIFERIFRLVEEAVKNLKGPGRR